MTAWPDFPPDYFGMLVWKHLRPGYGNHSTSWKYEIKQLDLDRWGGADAFYQAHISQSLNLWLTWRGLDTDLRLALQCGDMPIDVQVSRHFNKHDFIPAQHLRIDAPNTERHVLS